MRQYNDVNDNMKMTNISKLTLKKKIGFMPGTVKPEK
jgi:hypothetical protein